MYCCSNRHTSIVYVLLLGLSAFACQSPAGSSGTERAAPPESGAAESSGERTVRYANGDAYTGAFAGGRRHGVGRYAFANGEVFAGEFVSGKATRGTYTFRDGSTYEGDLNGRGRLRDAQGARDCDIVHNVLFCQPIETPAVTADAATQPAPLLVLFAAGNCQVRRDGQSFDGASGMSLFPGDRIEAGATDVEIQARGRIAIRLRAYSVLEIPANLEQSRTLILHRGGALLDYDETNEKKPPLRIRAAGTNFDVKGTTFAVEIDENSRVAKVRVYEGVVRMAPAAPALDDGSLPADDPIVQAARAALEAESVSVTANQEASVDPATRAQTEALNTAVEQYSTGTTSANEPDAATRKAAAEAAVRAAAESLSTGTPARPTQFEPSHQEKSETRLLILLDDETFQKATTDRPESAGTATPPTAEAVQKSYEQKLDAAATELQKDLSAQTEIRSKADLLKRYQILEVVEMRDGAKLAGSVVAQAGNLLILHAPTGVLRINRDDINQIDYYDVVDGNDVAGNSEENTPTTPAPGDTSTDSETPGP